MQTPAKKDIAFHRVYKFRAAVYMEREKLEKTRDAINAAYFYWKKSTHSTDELYHPVDFQRNLDLSSWHDRDKDALQDFLDMICEGERSCSGE